MPRWPSPRCAGRSVDRVSVDIDRGALAPMRTPDILPDTRGGCRPPCPRETAIDRPAVRRRGGPTRSDRTGDGIRSPGECLRLGQPAPRFEMTTADNEHCKRANLLYNTIVLRESYFKAEQETRFTVDAGANVMPSWLCSCIGWNHTLATVEGIQC